MDNDFKTHLENIIEIYPSFYDKKKFDFLDYID